MKIIIPHGFTKIPGKSHLDVICPVAGKKIVNIIGYSQSFIQNSPGGLLINNNDVNILFFIDIFGGVNTSSAAGLATMLLTGTDGNGNAIALIPSFSVVNGANSQGVFDRKEIFVRNLSSIFTSGILDITIQGFQLQLDDI